MCAGLLLGLIMPASAWISDTGGKITSFGGETIPAGQSYVTVHDPAMMGMGASVETVFLTNVSADASNVYAGAQPIFLARIDRNNRQFTVRRAGSTENALTFRYIIVDVTSFNP